MKLIDILKVDKVFTGTDIPELVKRFNEEKEEMVTYAGTEVLKGLTTKKEDLNPINVVSRYNETPRHNKFVSAALIGALEKIAAELTYMHALKGDLQSAQQCAKLCEKFLKTETAVARRVLAACAFAGGKTDECLLLKESAENYLEKELIAGVVKAEKILLSRICAV